MIRLAQVLMVSVAMVGATAASARHYDDAPQYEWARVVSVDPIIETYDSPVSRDVCYNAPTRYYEPSYTYRSHRDTGGSTLAGAIIGGALGNLVGKGDGRKAATIAGAVIGGSIGHDNARRHGGYYESGGYYREGYERRCDTHTDYRQEQEVVGYDVTYVYNGRNYHTRTDSHPGSRIQVAVDVNPVR